jgi:hypothetical protein
MFDWTSRKIRIQNRISFDVMTLGSGSLFRDRALPGASPAAAPMKTCGAHNKWADLSCFSEGTRKRHA